MASGTLELELLVVLVTVPPCAAFELSSLCPLSLPLLAVPFALSLPLSRSASPPSWSTFSQRNPGYHRDTFEACDDTRVVLREGRGYRCAEGNSREQKASSKSIRETQSLLRRRHTRPQMPSTETSMPRPEAFRISDKIPVDSSCTVLQPQCRKCDRCRAVMASVVASVFAHGRSFRNVVRRSGLIPRARPAKELYAVRPTLPGLAPARRRPARLRRVQS